MSTARTFLASFTSCTKMDLALCSLCSCSQYRSEVILNTPSALGSCMAANLQSNETDGGQDAVRRGASVRCCILKCPRTAL